MANNLSKIASLFAARYRKPIICEACGNPFDCGASLKGCWCAQIELSEEQRSHLKALYTNCLCSNCLKAISSSDIESDKTQRKANGQKEEQVPSRAEN
jgi:hypothetical protein